MKTTKAKQEPVHGRDFPLRGLTAQWEAARAGHPTPETVLQVWFNYPNPQAAWLGQAELVFHSRDLGWHVLTQ